MRVFRDRSSTTSCIALVGLVAFSLTLAATPGSGILFNNFSRSTLVGDSIHQGAHFPGWNLQMELEGPTDIVQQDVALVPGGFSGWHSHPTALIITVKSGTATWYSEDSPTCTPIIYPAGSAFIEPAGLVHFVANTGSTNLELLGTYIVPMGMATRQEAPSPSQCPF